MVVVVMETVMVVVEEEEDIRCTWMRGRCRLVADNI